MSIRAFIALPVPAAVREVLAGFGDDIPPGAGRIKWVATDAMHLTLQFLGEIEVAQVEPVEAALRTAAAGTGPYRTALADVGGFPDLERPGVVWVGLSEGADETVRLKKAVDTSLIPLGFEPEHRQFHPHLTVARVKEAGRRGLLAESAASWVVPREGWTTDSVHLYRSDLRPSGPVYTLLSEVRLGSP